MVGIVHRRIEPVVVGGDVEPELSERSGDGRGATWCMPTTNSQGPTGMVGPDRRGGGGVMAGNAALSPNDAQRSRSYRRRKTLARRGVLQTNLRTTFFRWYWYDPVRCAATARRLVSLATSPTEAE